MRSAPFPNLIYKYPFLATYTLSAAEQKIQFKFTVRSLL